MSHVVKLTEDELAYCKALGVKRHMAKHPSFRNSRNYRKQQFAGEIHMIGVMGEYAYHKLTGCELDKNIYATGDGGQDFEHNGKKVEVRVSTFGPSGTEVKVPKREYQRHKPDEYVLVYIGKNKFNEVNVLGKISRENFDKKKREKQYGPRYPVNYIVGAEDLDALDI